MKRTARALLVSILVLGCSQLGCSFMFVKRAPRSTDDAPHDSGEVECSYRPVAPVVDLIVASSWAAVAYGVGMIGAAGDSDPAAPEQSGISSTVVVMIVTSLALAGLHTGSALWGFKATRECRLYRRQHSPDRIGRLNVPGPMGVKYSPEP